MSGAEEQQTLAEAKGGRSAARRNAALVAMIVGASLGGLAQTAMNTMLASISAEMGVTVSFGQWLVTVFQLAMGIVIPLVAFLSRKLSTRRLFVWSVLLFTVGCAVCLIAPSFAWLFAGRLLMGASAGVMFPLVQVVVLAEYPREKWGSIMGIVGLAMGFAPNIGPTIAGAFTSAYGWRSMFVFLTVFAAATTVALAVFLPKKEAEGVEGKLDVPSVVLSTVALGGLLMACTNASSYGFASLEFALPCAVGAVALVVFVRRENALVRENVARDRAAAASGAATQVAGPGSNGSRASDSTGTAQTAASDERRVSMLNLSCLRDRDFAAGIIMVCLLFVAFIGVTLVIPLELQSVHGFSALAAGMAMLPGTVAALIMNPLSGRLMDRIGARFITCLGSVLLVTGTVLMLHLGEIDSLWTVMLFQGVRAFGISSLIMPISTWCLHGLPPNIVADGTSVSNAVRQVAAAFGTSLMVLLMAGGATDGSVTAAGVDAAMLLSLVAASILMVMCFVFIKRPAPRA